MNLVAYRPHGGCMTSMTDTIDVLLYGLGAIGSFYAFILQRNDQVRLTVVARSNYEAVNKDGIFIDSANHGQHRFRPHAVVRSPSEVTHAFDYVVLAHKAIDQDAAASQLQSVVNASTTMVIIQNGVGNEEPFRRLYPESSIITCVTWVGATQIQPGTIKHTQSEDLQIGLYPNSSLDRALEETRLSKFATLLSNGKTRFQILGDDIQRQRWEKVVWNAAWNSLTTLTMVDTQSWLHSSSTATPVTRRLMREVIDVGRACGVPLEYTLIDALMDKILAMPGIGSSMQTDCRNGRPLEVDVILGFPAQKAKELGMDTPMLEMVHVLVRAVDLRLRGSVTTVKSCI